VLAFTVAIQDRIGVATPRYRPGVARVRNLIRRSSGSSGSRSIIPRWVSTAQRTASITLENSAKKPFAGVLDGPASVLGDLRLDQLPEMGLQALVRPLLIRPHQARVARQIGGEDCGEAADRGHFLPGIDRLNQIYFGICGGPSVEIRVPQGEQE